MKCRLLPPPSRRIPYVYFPFGRVRSRPMTSCRAWIVRVVFVRDSVGIFPFHLRFLTSGIQLAHLLGSFPPLSWGFFLCYPCTPVVLRCWWRLLKYKFLVMLPFSLNPFFSLLLNFPFFSILSHWMYFGMILLFPIGFFWVSYTFNLAWAPLIRPILACVIWPSLHQSRGIFRVLPSG